MHFKRDDVSFLSVALTLCLVLSADDICKQYGPVWIQTVCHSAGIPVRIFRKS